MFARGSFLNQTKNKTSKITISKWHLRFKNSLRNFALCLILIWSLSKKVIFSNMVVLVKRIFVALHWLFLNANRCSAWFWVCSRFIDTYRSTANFLPSRMHVENSDFIIKISVGTRVTIFRLPEGLLFLFAKARQNRGRIVGRKNKRKKYFCMVHSPVFIHKHFRLRGRTIAGVTAGDQWILVT